jgi:hypothetical protein
MNNDERKYSSRPINNKIFEIERFWTATALNNIYSVETLTGIKFVTWT